MTPAPGIGFVPVPEAGVYILIQKIFTIYTTPWLTPVQTRAKIKYEFVF